MCLSNTKLTAVLGAVFALFLGFAGTASADPGKGLRWSDLAWGSAPRGQSMRPAPSYTYPRAYSPAPPASAVVMSPTPAPGTIAIRGPDGVVRAYPVEGGVIVQRQTGLPGQATQTVTVRDADGVVRTYPVVTDPAVPGQIVGPAQPGVVTVPLRHCR